VRGDLSLDVAPRDVGALIPKLLASGEAELDLRDATREVEP
jgi:hypothetical protein